MAKKLLCTPAVVGMLNERGKTLRQISALVGESVETVQKYLKEWKDAKPHDRHIAREGTTGYLKGR